MFNVFDKSAPSLNAFKLGESVATPLVVTCKDVFLITKSSKAVLKSAILASAANI